MTHQHQQWIAADKAAVMAAQTIVCERRRLGDITIVSLVILWILALPLAFFAIAILLSWGEIALSLAVLVLFAGAVGIVLLSD